MSAESDSSETLSSQFDKALELYNDLCNTTDPSNSAEYQGKVKKVIHMLEESTRCVSSLGIFSSNESVEEVSTADIKFFLLPVLLGDLHLKLSSEDRLSILNVAEIYFKDFLQRCKDYQVTDIEIPGPECAKEDEPKHPGPMSFEEMARQREAKIKKFKETKDLEAKLMELKKALDNPSRDETVARDYYLTLLKKFISSSVDEVKSIAQEKPIVEHIAKMKKSGQSPKKPQPPHKPLKPIIITRDAAQKAVYGLGYPSLPAMTVEELVDQRLKEGWYGKNAGQPLARSLMDEASNTEAANLQLEKEETEKDRKTEVDDEAELARARAFDDWKDDHRRGEGNRYNMG